MARKITVLVCLLMMCVFALAQPGTVEMADGFRSHGKIYVVVAVVLTIFAGLIIYLVRLDRKINKLEKNSLVNQSADSKH